MAFDVSKFLALTALIASTGAVGSACSSTDKTPDTAGSSGSGSSGSAGKSSNAGGDNGNGGAAAGNGGEAAQPGGAPGAGAGGESVGGAEAGGAGGTPSVGECLGSLAEGGAGGAPAVEPSLEDLCMDFFNVTCPAAAEGTYAPSYMVCEGVKAIGQSAVAVAVADCIKALSAEDACDNAKVAACYTGLEGKGCSNPDSAAVCAVMQGRDGCAAIAANCDKIADLVRPDMFEGFTGCMNPTDEGWYDPGFTGTCAQRLENCAGVNLPL